MKKSILTKNAIKYTISHLFDIANPKSDIHYDITIKGGDERSESPRKVVVRFLGHPKRIVFFLGANSDWYSLISEENNEPIWIDNYRGNYKIPVLFWANSDNPFVTMENENEAVFYGDIISSSFFMLSRWEETQTKDLDSHGRFKYKNSLAYKHDFVTLPIVDEYAMLLRETLSHLFPNRDLGKRKFKVKLSHDIDNIRRFANFKKAIRTLGGDLIKTRSLHLVVNSVKEYFQSVKNPKVDPYFLAIYQLAKLSREHNVESAFYFMAAEPSDYDSGYDIKSVRGCISHLCDEGFEVGFHPGYYTFRDYNRFTGEKERLDKVLGTTPYGGRQHYLRFDVNSTWRYWAKAGLKYDSTLGYAEHEGFRAGTCHPFRPFDLSKDSVLDVIEKPLIVMDGTLQGYRNLRPSDGLKAIRDLAEKCAAVEGVFTLLWHNTSVGRGWRTWHEQVYLESLRHHFVDAGYPS